MAEKSTQKERLKEITDSIETGILELFESDKYTQYLRTMSRFHKYSLNNTMLISLQDPNATAVAGFNKWKNQFSRTVKKGEKGIKIIAPTPYKIKEQREKIDPQTKAPMLDGNGKVQTEEVEKQIPMFRVVSVFDVLQTEGEPLPTLATDLTGNVEQFEIFIEALQRSAPVPIAFEQMADDTDGYYHSMEKRIAIREGMSQVQTISATIHEIAHSKLHNREQQEQVETDETALPIPKKSRATEEVEAESISFAVCNYYGIETGENSLGYIANWSKGKELKELKSSLETINKTSSQLITDIDRHFAQIVKDRGLNLTPHISEAEQAPEKIAYEVGERYLTIHNVDEGNEYTFYDKDFNLIDGGVHDDPEWTVYDVARDVLSEGDVPPFINLGDFKEVDYEEITEKADNANMVSTFKKTGIEVIGHTGTWYVVDETVINDTTYFLLEHEQHGDMAACIIVDVYKNIVIEDVWNGFDDLIYYMESEEIPTVELTNNSYPMPDPTVSIAECHKYGYIAEELLPLSKERATELFNDDFTIFTLYSDNSEAMIFELEEMDKHDGLFGIEKVDWDAFLELKAMQNLQWALPPEKEQSFVAAQTDSYAIYQIKSGGDYRDYRFEDMESVTGRGLRVERENYNFLYTDELENCSDPSVALNVIYNEFNCNKPADFMGHSLSVSDIIAINMDGMITSHYVDSFGFAEIPRFIESSSLMPDAFLTGEMIDTPRGSFSFTTMTEAQMQAAGYGVHHATDDGKFQIMGNGTRAFAIKNDEEPIKNIPTVAQLEQDSKNGKPISIMELLDATRREQKTKPPQKIKKSTEMER